MEYDFKKNRRYVTNGIVIFICPTIKESEINGIATIEVYNPIVQKLDISDMMLVK